MTLRHGWNRTREQFFLFLVRYCPTCDNGIVGLEPNSKTKQQKERKKHESINSVQKITNSADSDCAWLLCAARECGDHAGFRNRRVQQRLSTAGRESTRRSWGLPSDRIVRESGRLLVHVRLQI